MFPRYVLNAPFCYMAVSLRRLILATAQSADEITGDCSVYMPPRSRNSVVPPPAELNTILSRRPRRRSRLRLTSILASTPAIRKASVNPRVEWTGKFRPTRG